MTSIISIIFILSSNVLIFNIPASHGLNNNQGYHLSTLSQVLTPPERLAYTLFGTLPSRIYYSYKKRCYVVRGQPGYYTNDLRRKKGKRYKVVPRWQYYLNKLSPVDAMKSGFQFLSIGKALLFGGGFGGDDEDDNLKGDDADDDVAGGADNNAADGADNNAAGDADNNAAGGADDDTAGGAVDDAAGGADDDNDNKKEPGLLSKGMNMGKSVFSQLFNLFGGSKNNDNDNNDKKDENKDNNNDEKDEKKDDNNDKKDEKQDDNKDNKEGEKPEDSSDYLGIAKDVLQSDTAKDAVKTGISLFVPGGPAIVAAMEAASKLNSAGNTVNKVEDKIPKFK